MILGQLIEYLFFPVCDFITFEINLVFLIKHFFSMWPSSQDKNLNILRTKRAFKIIFDHF